MNPKPTGEIVYEAIEFGHHFQIEKLIEPMIKGGNSKREYRLWDNGFPASGGQWLYDIESGIERAKYLLQCEYCDRISWLEQRVNVLQRENAELRKQLNEF